MRVRGWLRNVALLAAGFVTLGLAAEGITRFLRPRTWLPGDPDPVGAIHRRSVDPVQVYELRPDSTTTLRSRGREITYAINSVGLRDSPALSGSKPPGSFRVLVLGDSVAFGLGVALEDTIAKRLEAELAGRKVRIECINLGVCGYDAIQEMILLRRVGAPLAPDVVVLIYNLNDAVDFAGELGYFFRLQAYGVPFPGDSLRRRLFPDSLFLRWASSRLLLARGPRHAAVSRMQADMDESRRSWIEAVFRRHPGEAGAPPVVLSPPGRTASPAWAWIDAAYRSEPGWTRVRAAMFDLADQAREGGITVVFAIVPAFLTGSPYPFHEIHRALAEQGPRHGFLVVDLLEASEGGALLGMSQDGLHPTAEGNAAIARELVATVVEALGNRLDR